MGDIAFGALRRTLNFSLLGSVCVLALAVTPAAAQTAASVEPQTSGGEANGGNDIVVTGFRSSMATALNNKRADIRVTDGISAEDIGKFPSENITEAIQRISGVQMSNINGRGATISIRGLGPQYANTTINGQTFLSADFTDGFRYDIVQTELASSIQVVKSPIASMDAGGLSGTVNIDTVKPLDYRGDHLVVSLKGQKAQTASGGVTPKVSGSYVNKFFDDTLGVFVNAGYQGLKDRADYMWMDRWFTSQTSEGTVYTPQRLRFRRIDRETKRLLLNGGLQWRPTPELEVNATAIYAKDNTKYDVNQQVFGMNLAGMTILETNGLTNTHIIADNVWTDNNRQAEKRRLSSGAYTLSAKWDDDVWHASAVGHYTRGKAYWREDAAIIAILRNDLELDFADPDNIKLTPGTSLDDAGAYTADTILRNTFPSGATRIMVAQERAGQADLTRDLDVGPLKSISFGTKMRHESFSRHVERHDRYIQGDADLSDLPNMASDNYQVSDFLNGSMSVPGSWIAPDLDAYRAALKAEGVTVPDLFAPEASYRVDRYIPSVYGMINLDTTLFSLPVRGNIGLRYERTKQVISGYLTQNDPDGEVDIPTGTYKLKQKYGNFLPSASVVVDVADGILVRAAAAKVLVRQLLNSETSLARISSSGVDAQGRRFNAINLGQAGLAPLTANQADLGIEYYYGKGNAVSLNGFYKAIKNGTFSNLICPATYEGVSLSYDANGDCVGSDAAIYDITQTLNDPSTTTIKGLEFAWTQSLDGLLPVDGFGFTGNFTRVFPKEVAIGSGYRVRNLSKQTWNFTGYWENDMFSIRGSVNRRSPYEQDFSDSFFAREGHTIRTRTQIDLALGLTLTKNLSFAAGVINLNNAKEEAYKDLTNRWQMTSVTGRNFYLSASWRM